MRPDEASNLEHVANVKRYDAHAIWIDNPTDDEADQAAELEAQAAEIEDRVRAAGYGASLVGPIPLAGHGVPEFDGLGHR